MKRRRIDQPRRHRTRRDGQHSVRSARTGWYAAYLQPRLGDLLHRSFSIDELVNLVLLLEAERTANPTDRPWPPVYADLLVAHLSGGDAADKA